jgi:hypothetical protein
MNMDRDRVISISLSEAEWQAFIARHPQPVHWLREQIKSTVQAESAPARESQGPDGLHQAR